MLGKYYTVDEVSEMIGMHPKTIRRFIREGKLKANKVGKQWRITGHDLSIFAEGTNANKHLLKNDVEFNTKSSAKTHDENIKVSSVVDINVVDMDKAMRISNTLMAVLNNKDPKYGNSTMNVQFIEKDLKIRVMLYGNIQFIKIMLDSISTLAN
ncbi:MAG: helix-turn-helix domain-containing protein [Eubacteriaceae bacterium]